MISTDNGSVEEDKSKGREVKTPVPLQVNASQKGLLGDENTQVAGSDTALANTTLSFYRFVLERDKFSRTIPSTTSHAFRERVTRVFSRKIDWTSLWKMAKEWIKNPINMVLFVWILCVAISGAILFLVMTGMLNNALPKKSQRNMWFEVNNQILNALFTLMCLYQHPHRLYHLVLLLRWKSEDVSKLRKLYCKNETYKPHEWAHMLVVISLLNLNCVAQYALCGLNLGYRRSERPAIGVAITISVAIASPAIAGIYSVVSPLGKDYDMVSDEESQLKKDKIESNGSSQQRVKSLERRFSFALRDEASTPKWSGGILDFWEDISLAYLSMCCSFCVFGWNMERLGFGNMYVHIATFSLFCLAPFWIFNLAAINLNNEIARNALGITGMFLCIFGLLYGGFWRIQMRKRFNLPKYNFCCGKPAITDCALWLFCCWCSLAQEVRTGNSYDIIENKFYKKPQDEYSVMPISPLPREGEKMGFRSGPSSPLQNPVMRPSMVEEDTSSRGKDSTLEPPVISFIQREAS